jgi:hypothetical protein
MNRFGQVALLVAVIGLLAGCSDDEPVARAPVAPAVETPAAPSTVVPVESPSAVAVTDCAGVDPGNPLHRVSGPMIGDVDGEAAPDHVYLTVDQAGPEGCRAFVFVSGVATFAAPIQDWDPAAGLSSPTLNRLVQIDGRPGAEVVVNLAAGASTQFVGAWSGFGADLQRIVAEDRASDPSTGGGSLFAFGGSVGHLEAVDCTTAADVVISSAIPKGARYQVERRFYTPEGASLNLEAAKTEHPIVSADRINDFPEFGASPFGTCPST